MPDHATWSGGCGSAARAAGASEAARRRAASAKRSWGMVASVTADAPSYYAARRTGTVISVPWRALVKPFLMLAAFAAAAPAAEPSLRFERPGAAPRTVAAAELRAACKTETVEVDDPYYERRKRFLAWPLRCVLEQGLGGLGADFAE